MQLKGSPGSLKFPELCANCGAPAGRRLPVEKVFRRNPGLHQPEVYVVLGAAVPFCAACIAKHQSESSPMPPVRQALTMLRSVLMIPAIGFTLITLWLLPAFLNNTSLLFFGFMVLFAALAVGSWRGAWQQSRRYRVPGPTSVTSAFDFTDDQADVFEREWHTYQLRAPTFAAAFEAANRSRLK